VAARRQALQLTPAALNLVPPVEPPRAPAVWARPEAGRGRIVPLAERGKSLDDDLAAEHAALQVPLPSLKPVLSAVGQSVSFS
jgi:hypothetical protein